MKKILVINPGSTSTKFAVYHDEECAFEKTLRHQGEELAPYPNVAAQYEFRKTTILNALKEAGIEPKFDIVVGRGGLLHPVTSGAIEVNDEMCDDLRAAKYGEHACNLGGLIAIDIARSCGCKAIIADPVVVDELNDIARVTGFPELPKRSILHTLNQKAIARRYAKEEGKAYDKVNVVVAHLGGGISVSAHCQGRIIDTNNALAGNGPFTPERTGTLCAKELVDLCYSGKYTHDEMKKKLVGKGGLMALMGVNDARSVHEMAKAGDEKAKLVFDAMAYNVAKEIGAMAVAMNGKVDAILITGGIAYNEYFVNFIREMVQFIAPVKAYPGEDELGALASNGYRVLNGEPCQQYSK